MSMSGLIFQVILFLILFSVGWGFGRHIEQKHLRELDEKKNNLPIFELIPIDLLKHQQRAIGE
jgi:hypothetical protein